MSGETEKSLTPKQHKAIVALLSQPTIEAAAKEVGVGAATLRRWLKDEEFETVYKRECGRLFEVAIGRLQAATTQAADALVGVLEDSGVSDGVRVRAAGMILDRAFRGLETLDLLERIEVLEEMLDE